MLTGTRSFCIKKGSNFRNQKKEGAEREKKTDGGLIARENVPDPQGSNAKEGLNRSHKTQEERDLSRSARKKGGSLEGDPFPKEKGWVSDPNVSQGLSGGERSNPGGIHTGGVSKLSEKGARSGVRGKGHLYPKSPEITEGGVGGVRGWGGVGGGW